MTDVDELAKAAELNGLRRELFELRLPTLVVRLCLLLRHALECPCAVSARCGWPTYDSLRCSRDWMVEQGG